jgi:hypothetical protein
MLPTDLSKVIAHLRDREYMGGVSRDQVRVDSTGEVFTPTSLVIKTLDAMDKSAFIDPKETFLEPSCGDGQFLSEVIIRKMENNIPYEVALSTVYGIDLMEDNCLECIKRLYGVYREPKIRIIKGDDIPEEWQSTYKVTTIETIDGKKIRKTTIHKSLTAVFEIDGKICNIVCGDGLTYDYRFGVLPTVIDDAPSLLSSLLSKAKKAKARIAETGLFDFNK